MEHNYKIPHIRIKIKSLAAEGRIIKFEEKCILKRRNRFKMSQSVEATSAYAGLDLRYNSVRQHRIIVVRREARASLIAYAFLKGKPLWTAEKYPPPAYIIEKAAQIALRFCSGRQKTTVDTFKDWARTPYPEAEKPKGSPDVVL